MISILVALNSEAKPLIDYFSLKKSSLGPYGYYLGTSDVTKRGGHNTAGACEAIELVVSGIGALAMASAVGWLAGVNPVKRVWLNLGIAGHASKKIGEIVLVHGCADAVHTKAHYPPLVAKWSHETAACLSYNAPCTDYPGDAAVDMEAHSFFTSGLRFSSAEFVQSLKVISDNQDSSIDDLDAKKVEALIKPHVATIANFAEKLSSLRMSAVPWVDHGLQLGSLRSTHSQTLQAQELLVKATVLNVLDDDLKGALSSCQKMSEVLAILHERTRLQSPALIASNALDAAATLAVE